MKHKFEELYQFIKLNHQLSEWAQKTTLKERTKELKKEINEMMKELEKDDPENFRKELGDVLWDLLGIIVRAEDEGLLDIKKFLDEVHNKYKQRKPFLLGKKKVSLEEEKRIWRKIKIKEKNAKNNPPSNI